MNKNANYLIASEYDEQCRVIDYCDIMKIPVFAIPNGGSRHLLEAVKLKRSGVRAGVPDLCIPLVRKGYNGLYIEMKRKGGKLRIEQKDWLELLNNNGYLAKACWGFDEAKELIEKYI